MKYLNLCLTATSLFITVIASAQSPQQIETDLVKSFKKIAYYADKQDYERIADAPVLFGEKLENYARKFPMTISYPFNQLKKEGVSILSSTDGLFRIYSWDDGTGGTMRYFDNIFQYKIDGKTAVLATIKKPEGEGGSMYQDLYTFNVNRKTYYLATTLGIGSTIIYVRGIQVFSIENGKLNTNTKIIKTKTGLHSQINYDYDLSKTDEKVTSEIYFDAGTQSIYVPVVLGQGKLTDKFILYKFTGQYFERVKN